MWDLNPMGGGRIVRDRLWFYLTYRETRGDSTVPGMWINKNAGNPNAWTVDFNKTKQTFDDNINRNGIVRITWQATPRNKINLYWSELYQSSSKNGGGSATVTPEAATYTTFHPDHVQQATWSSPMTSRICWKRDGEPSSRDTATRNRASTARTTIELSGRPNRAARSRT